MQQRFCKPSNVFKPRKEMFPLTITKSIFKVNRFYLLNHSKLNSDRTDDDGWDVTKSLICQLSKISFAVRRYSLLTPYDKHLMTSIYGDITKVSTSKVTPRRFEG